MAKTREFSLTTILSDLTAGMVVFFVAVPLCLGIALASGAPLFAGLVAGIIGGIVVGVLSGSHTSVSGPAAGLTAVVASQIESLGSLQVFLLALLVGGLVQIALGLARAGFIAEFFPSSVIKGLLAAIGVIIVLKQIPHLLGHDTDPDGQMAFYQPDQQTTFSALWELATHIHPAAAAIGLASIAIMVVWEWYKPLKKGPVPGPLLVVIVGVAMSRIFDRIGGAWLIEDRHLVQVPVAESLSAFVGFLQLPDFTAWANPAVYIAGLTIALVASLETLLNLQAVERLDPQQRKSSANRELFAQGIGNVTAGLLGGIPVTSVIVRGSVNINAGARTKLSTIVHGVLLLTCVMLLPEWLNLIPLSCLAAILLVTGVKLASPKLVRQMWSEGPNQFVPFVVTVVAIVLSDLLIGIGIGLAVSLGFILNSNLRRPIRRFVEKRLSGEVLHIELANQVSFLNRAALSKVLDAVPRDGHVLLDAQYTDYIDSDVLSVIRDFKEKKAPARGVQVSFVGFRDQYRFEDQIQYIDFSTRELQSAITPEQVLQILKDGNERFRTGRRLTRDLGRQVNATAQSQHPLAVVLSCIDSRTPAELILDLGVGDIFSIRVAGNICSPEVLGSMEYGCAVAGAKLILVVGHTRCGAVTTAVAFNPSSGPVAEATGCEHIESIVHEIQQSIDTARRNEIERLAPAEKESIIDDVAHAHVLRTVRVVRKDSQTLSRLLQEGRIAIVGAMYDVATGRMKFLPDDAKDSDGATRSSDAGESKRTL
jgi:carbonic anhydrase